MTTVRAHPPGAAPLLGHRFVDALELALEIHGGERRDGTEIPFVAHLLVVCGLVLEDGGEEDQAVAALLHDAVEDGGGEPLLERIAKRFGPRVAEIVAGCTDNLRPGAPGESWAARKRRHLAHLASVTDDGVLRVALADKVHNARSLVRDCRDEGDALWERFADRTPGQVLWYQRRLLALFEERRPGPLTVDLRRAVGELELVLATGRSG